jgi:Holliday junction resolvasome RuvABC ATP-dependent DNA helicase subunit
MSVKPTESEPKSTAPNTLPEASEVQAACLLQEFVGQAELVRRLQAMVALCKTKATVFPHVVMIGSQGLGGTTLTKCVAHELGINLHIAEAQDLDATDLAAVVNNLEAHDILLLRDLGRMRRQVVKRLVPALVDFEFHIIVGEGMGAREMKLVTNPFSCFATFARAGDCDPELLRSFHLALKFKPYSLDEMRQITEQMTSHLRISLKPQTVTLIARASKGSPGEVEKILRWLSRQGVESLSEQDAQAALDLIGISADNFEPPDAASDFALLDPLEFERFITGLLHQMGFEAQTTKASGDGGIDIEAVLDRPIVGGRYLFQCKRFAQDNPVGSAAVREFYGALIADRKAAKGVFITTSTFTPQARDFAHGLSIELIDGDQLRRLLDEQKKTTSDR